MVFEIDTTHKVFNDHDPSSWMHHYTTPAAVIISTESREWLGKWTWSFLPVKYG